MGTLVVAKDCKRVRYSDVQRPEESRTKQEECEDLVEKSRKAVFAFQLGCWGSVVDPLQKPYWTRLWILQEVSLGKNAILTCGPDHISRKASQAAFAMLCWIYWRALDRDRV